MLKEQIVFDEKRRVQEIEDEKFNKTTRIVFFSVISIIFIPLILAMIIYL